MAVKLGKKETTDERIDIVNDLEKTAAEVKTNGNTEKPNIVGVEDNEDSLLIEKEEAPKRKMFANKRANMAIGIIAAVAVVAFVAGFVYINFIMK